jgi:inner membrane protein
MDPVTHALSGMVLHKLGFKRKAALFVLVLSAVVPDIDYVTRFWGADVFLHYHRGITHGFLALLLFPLITGFLFRNKGGFLYYAFLSFLGYASHLFLDFTNQYGIQFLAPLDWNRYSLDLTFIIDPYIIGGLLAALILARISRWKPALIAVCTVTLLACYIGGRYYMQGEARQFLKKSMDANVYRVYPLPNGLLRWWFVVKSADEATTGTVDLFMQKVFIYRKYNMRTDDPAVAESKKQRSVQNFLSFAAMPYAEVKREPGKTIILWRELSYSFLPGERFSVEVVLDAKGKVIKSSLKI